MKKTFLLVAITLSTLVVSVTEAMATKVALINRKYVLQNFSMIKDSVDTIASSRERVQRLIATADEEIKELVEKKAEAKKIQTRQEEIQRILDKEVLNLQNEQVDIKKAIDQKIEVELAKIAKARGLDIILDTGYVVDGGEDITFEFLDQLEKSIKK